MTCSNTCARCVWLSKPVSVLLLLTSRVTSYSSKNTAKTAVHPPHPSSPMFACWCQQCLLQIPTEKHKPGRVWHTVGYPLPSSLYGGSFLYHMDNNQVALGYAFAHSHSTSGTSCHFATPPHAQVVHLCCKDSNKRAPR